MRSAEYLYWVVGCLWCRSPRCPPGTWWREGSWPATARYTCPLGYTERERDSNMGPLVCVGHLATNSLPADHSSYNRHQENQLWAKKWLRYPVEIDSPWYDIPGSHTPERLTHMGNGMIPSVPGYHTPGRLTRQDIISRGDLKFWINRRILDQNRTYYN